MIRVYCYPAVEASEAGSEKYISLIDAGAITLFYVGSLGSDTKSRPSSLAICEDTWGD